MSSLALARAERSGPRFVRFVKMGQALQRARGNAFELWQICGW
jgi:hypothetical protein